jgi:hypothetical protein
VLCSVEAPRTALREIHRVLRPGAPARFLEHVRSSHRGLAAGQALLNPLWRCVDGHGCNLNRDTVAEIRSAGFRIERMDTVRLPGIWGPLFPFAEIYARA